MSFNPLHPSMELPPEQLIRLLAVSTKQRATRSSRKPKPGDAPAFQKAEALHRPTATLADSLHRATMSNSRRTVESPPSERRLLKISSGVIVAAVIGLSAYYLFTSQTSELETPPAPQATPRLSQPLSSSQAIVPEPRPSVAPVSPETVHQQATHLREMAAHRFQMRLNALHGQESSPDSLHSGDAGADPDPS
jgi:hypothetical protein